MDTNASVIMDTNAAVIMDSNAAVVMDTKLLEGTRIRLGRSSRIVQVWKLEFGRMKSAESSAIPDIHNKLLQDGPNKESYRSRITLVVPIASPSPGGSLLPQQIHVESESATSTLEQFSSNLTSRANSCTSIVTTCKNAVHTHLSYASTTDYSTFYSNNSSPPRNTLRQVNTNKYASKLHNQSFDIAKASPVSTAVSAAVASNINGSSIILEDLDSNTNIRDGDCTCS